MKIILFTDTLRSGGKERQLVELAKGLKTKPNIEVLIVTMSEEVYYTDILDLGIELKFLIRKRKKDFSIFIKFYEICKKFKPDIVHTWDWMPTFYSMFLKQRFGFKLINGSIRNVPPNLKENTKLYFISKFTFVFSDMILGNSKAGLEVFNVHEKKGVCVYNGFDTQRVSNLICKEKVRTQFKIDSTDTVIGMVASFTAFKDFTTFFKAAQLIIEQKQGVIFFAVGDGPIKNEMQKLFGHTKQIRFLGMQKDIESIVNIFEIGVLTSNSKIHGEGISNSIMEYMVLQKPVIATENGANKEIVRDGYNGYLVEDKDYKSVADKIIFLLENKEKCKELGHNSYSTIENKFSLEKMLSETISVYLKVLEKV